LKFFGFFLLIAMIVYNSVYYVNLVK